MNDVSPDTSVALHAKRLIDFTSAAAADIFTSCFEGYVVPVRFQPEGFERRNRSEHVDVEASQIWFRGEAPVGAILVARRGWTSRVAAMGVVTSARGTGVGGHMASSALAAARERGDKRMLLEVIESNTAAVALYEGVGFKKLRRLVGYNRSPATSPSLASTKLSGSGSNASDSALHELDVLEAARIIGASSDPNLPWMLTVETLASLTTPVQAFTLGSATVLTSELPDTVVIRALAVPPSSRRQGQGRALIDALAARYESKSLKLVSVVPEALAPEFFTACDFTHDAITQFELEARF